MALKAISFNDVTARTQRVDSGETLVLDGGMTIADNLIIAGDLTVNGASTTLNVATLEVEDLNITVAKNATTSAQADGAGLTVAGASATFVYADTGTKWVANKSIEATSFIGNASSATVLANARTIGGVSFDGSANINLPGVNASGNQDTSGNAATASALANAVNIGGVAFDGSASINLPGVNQSGNQDTSGNAATATKFAASKTIGGVAFDGSANIVPQTISIADEESENANRLILFADNSGSQQPKNDGDLQYNPSTGTVTASIFSGALSGNASSATILQNSRQIGGVAFDGSANITLPGVNAAGNQDTSGNAATATQLATSRNIGGVGFNGTSNIDLPGVNTAGNQDTSGNAASATVLANSRTIHGVAFDGSANIDLSEVIQDTVGAMFSGNTETGITATYEDSDGTIDLVVSSSSNITVADESTDQETFLVFTGDASGSQAPKTSSKAKFNAQAGEIEVTTALATGGAFVQSGLKAGESIAKGDILCASTSAAETVLKADANVADLDAVIGVAVSASAAGAAAQLKILVMGNYANISANATLSFDVDADGAGGAQTFTITFTKPGSGSSDTQFSAGRLASIRIDEGASAATLAGTIRTLFTNAPFNSGWSKTDVAADSGGQSFSVVSDEDSAAYSFSSVTGDVDGASEMFATTIAGADPVNPKIALPGSMVDVSQNLANLGQEVYLSETAGQCTQTAPSSSGSAVIRLGYCIKTGNGTSKILFLPAHIADL